MSPFRLRYSWAIKAHASGGNVRWKPSSAAVAVEVSIFLPHTYTVADFPSRPSLRTSERLVVVQLASTTP